MPTNAEKKAEAQREETLAKGSYAALEDGDNAIDVSNEEYIGVNPEYKNHAYDTEAPLATSSKDDKETAAIEERAKAYEAEFTDLEVNRAGHTIGPHRAGTGTKVGDDGDDDNAEVPVRSDSPNEDENRA